MAQAVTNMPMAPGSADLIRMNNFTTLAGRNGPLVYGSPYADNRWLPARVITTANTTTPLVPLKFDVLNQRLLMRPVDSPRDSMQLDDSQVISFELQEPAAKGAATHPTRMFRRFFEAPVPTQRPEYVEVLHEGKCALLKRYVKTVHKGTPHTSFDSSQSHDEIVDRPLYYVSLAGASAVRVKLTLKALQDAAPQLATALAAVPGADKAKSEAEWVAALALADPH